MSVNIGENVRIIRTLCKLSQQKIATELNMQQSYYCKMEKAGNFSEVHLQRIAEILNVKVSCFTNKDIDVVDFVRYQDRHNLSLEVEALFNLVEKIKKKIVKT